MALETELKYFESCKAELLRTHPDKYALIKGEELVGVYDTDEAAFQAGVARFGVGAFLVKKIVDHEPIQQFPALFAGVLSGPH